MKKILLVAIFCISIFLLTACSQADILTSSSSEIPLPSDSDTIARPKFENLDLKDFTLEEIESKNMISEDSEFMKTLSSFEHFGEATELLVEKLDINDFILIGLQIGYAIEQEEMDWGSLIVLIGVYPEAVIPNLSDQDMLSYIYNPDYNDAFKYLIMDFLYVKTGTATVRGDIDHISRQLAEDKSMSKSVRLQAAHNILDKDYRIDLRNEIQNED